MLTNTCYSEMSSAPSISYNTRRILKKFRAKNHIPKQKLLPELGTGYYRFWATENHYRKIENKKKSFPGVPAKFRKIEH